MYCQQMAPTRLRQPTTLRNSILSVCASRFIWNDHESDAVYLFVFASTPGFPLSPTSSFWMGKYRSYTAGLKLKVIVFAQDNSKRAAGRNFGVDDAETPDAETSAEDE
ncbi:hypothetical protein ISCGN_007012 [Ixodes scapularis]